MMSTALLQEVYQEVRRLYIAGSELSAGDFRLQKLLPRVEQLGERAAVFQKIAEGIRELINPQGITGEESASAVKLQRLALLLSSVLRTQGSTTAAGELQPVASRPASLTTTYTYRKIAPLQQALTTTGGGRYEVVKEAFAAGIFQDLRTLPLALGALNDAYVEIAEMATEQILPAYGSSIIPYMLDHFDPSGGRLEARKLKVIYRTGGADYMQLYADAAESGSEEVRTTAIAMLKGHEAYTPSLILWTRDKKKNIREAAYAALAGSRSQDAMDCLYHAFHSKDIELVTNGLREGMAEELTEKLLLDYWKDVEQILAEKEEKQLNKLQVRIEAYVSLFSSMDHALLNKLYYLILNHYSQFAQDRWYLLMNQVVYYVEQYGEREMLPLMFQLEDYREAYLPYAFRMAYRLLSPAELYEHYVGKEGLLQAGVVSKKRRARLPKLRQSIYSMLIRDEVEPALGTAYGSEEERMAYTLRLIPMEEVEQQWDARWLDWAVKIDDSELAAALVRPGMPDIQVYLIDKLKKNPEFRNRWAPIILQGLDRSGISREDKRELLWYTLDDKRNTSMYTLDPYIVRSLLQLPVEDIERLEALLVHEDSKSGSRFRYEAATQLEYVIHTLKGMRA